MALGLNTEVMHEAVAVLDAKPFMAALLAGASVRIEGEAPWLADRLPLGDGPLSIRVTEQAIPGNPIV